MNGPARFEAWWAAIARVLSFGGGLGILLFETLYENVDRPWLLAAAIGMMGPAVAGAVADVLSAARGERRSP